MLLAPEEDAFWIFTSIMDAHLRSYFATSTIQTEVDGALLSKALESNDSMLHKKIYVSLQMNPTNITRPWQVVKLLVIHMLTVAAGFLLFLWAPCHQTFSTGSGIYFCMKVRVCMLLSVCTNACARHDVFIPCWLGRYTLYTAPCLPSYL